MRTFRDYSHLFFVALTTFLVIYLSTFVSGYGYFIDEFYYIACAMHPAMGYVDHPPLAPLILTVFQALLGSSLAAIRFLPALAQSASVFLTGIIAKEIGGGRYAQFLAACSLAAAPTIVAFGGFYSMNAFEPLLAILLLLSTIRMIKQNQPKRWIPIGIISGLGVMNKHTFGLFIVCLILALLLAGKWRLFFNRWFVFAGVIGGMIVIPNLLWQLANDFPSLEFYRNISTRKNMYTPPLPFLMGQIMGMSPFAAPLWIAGTLYLLFAEKVREFRFLAFLFLALFAALMTSGTSRSDRLMFAYPAAFAGGGLFIEYVIERYRARWLKGIFPLLLAAGLALALPIILPYCPYDTVRSYVTAMGFNTEIERGKKPPLPQLLADRIGWEEKYVLVRRAYERLSPEERKESIIAAGNYGQAGAIELFGRKDTLCPVVSAHNTYYLWSRDRLRGNIVIELSDAGNQGNLEREFESVDPQPEEFASPYVSSHENHLKVFVCRNPKTPLARLLERGKHYY
jgi:hypothetical protein